MPAARPFVARSNDPSTFYGGSAVVTVSGAWRGTFTFEAADQRVACMMYQSTLRWLGGGRLLGTSAAAADDGVSFQVDEVHGRVDQPHTVTGRQVSLTLRDSGGTSFEGAASKRDGVPKMALSVSRDRRQIAVSATMLAHPAFSLTDKRIGWITVQIVVSCDGQPPAPNPTMAR
ncbi:hypothetical protein [Dactylosporangium sp. NPDC050588]|uniref:hypothetical protein n=1 Tax=Dactylosporangium sp. NPDC050588 TaxID=3157211 RepID=UPI0033CD65D3